MNAELEWNVVFTAARWAGCIEPATRIIPCRLIKFVCSTRGWGILTAPPTRWAVRTTSSAWANQVHAIADNPEF